MYLLGYSIDNLSLMALTIGTGFVVDDAIVVLENIMRHMEDGMPPREAALRGSAEVGFTVDRKSTRLNSSHLVISYAVFCLKKKKSPPPTRCHTHLCTRR